MRIVTLKLRFYFHGDEYYEIPYDLILDYGRYIFEDSDNTSILELCRRERKSAKKRITEVIKDLRICRNPYEIRQVTKNNKLTMRIEVLETYTDWYSKLNEYHEKFNKRDITSFLSDEEYLKQYNYPFENEYTYFINEDKLCIEKFFGFSILHDNSYGFGPNYDDNYRLELDRINKSIDDIDIGTVVSYKDMYTGKIVKELVIEKMILPWNEISIFSLDYECLDKIKKDGLKDGVDLNFYIDHLGGIDSILGVDNESIQWLRDKGYLETEEG